MNFVDALYLGCLVPLAPAMAWKTVTSPAFRQSIPERLGRLPPRHGGIWFHAASVGEVNAIKPIAAELRRRQPRLTFGVTTMTPAGRDTSINAFPNDTSGYAPLDLSGCVREAGRRWRPDLLAIVEQELWPNLILESRAPVLLVNGRITERSVEMYRRLWSVFRRVIRRFDRILVQTESYRERFLRLGADPARVQVTGNVKFDALPPVDLEEARALHRALLNLREDSMVIVGASTSDPEEACLADAFKALQPRFPDLRLVLAPRHIERVPQIMELLRARKLHALRMSERVPRAIAPVTVIDEFGKLVPAYSVATVVFVGGTIHPRGGQNLIEPASVGRPILVGPSLYNFRDVADALEEAGALRMVSGGDELAGAFASLLSDPQTLIDMALRAKRTVEAGRGTSARVADALLERLDRGKRRTGQTGC